MTTLGECPLRVTNLAKRTEVLVLSITGLHVAAVCRSTTSASAPNRSTGSLIS
jgi:hypothetical protein